MDYYAILGIDETADAREVKRAYRRLAMRLHPDQNPGDPEAEARFREIAEAYQVLADPERRRLYDLRLRMDERPSRSGAASGADDAAGSESFGEFLGGLFGSAWRKARARRGRDLSYSLEIDLEHVAAGLETTIEIPRERACGDCGGQGTRAGSRLEKCMRCRGLGEVERGGLGRLEACPDCRGRGQIPAAACISCDGVGVLLEMTPFQVHVPPGVITGHRIRHAGLGEKGSNGGAAGDLYVVIKVRPHELFVRDGNDIICHAPLPVAEAALGTALEVPTLGGGSVVMKVPAGTQHGRLFRLRGRGLPAIGSKKRGDLFVEIRLEVPSELTARQRELLEAFLEVSPPASHPSRAEFDRKLRAHAGAPSRRSNPTDAACAADAADDDDDLDDED